MRPFSEIAPYYDRLMSHVRYKIWVDYTKEIIRRNGIDGKRVLDLACGTGEPTRHLIRAGFDVVGLDRSEAMLEVAKAKLPDVKFIQADIRDFTLDERFDIVTSYYDSINYLLSEADLRSCFQSVFAVLNSPGLFIFDMNTIHVLKDHWDNRIVVREDGNIFSIWENGHDPTTNISTLKLTVFVREGKRYLRLREIHKERGYSLELVLENLRRVGFQECQVYHHLTFNPPHRDTDRVMFVARR
ncbi:hypothetical protein DRP53_00870 [candidate division WOR-3 bacterium]|uniref:Methyltransferase domain-containing protein n=1 Tax=candidate division WOR-3 bacterium TaxID=2052148 RepID=A0A660SNX0_UNCW3|nr:MAG: hypothetical protein DRP53_00870 [candidate division WOR-3 bacterium]